MKRLTQVLRERRQDRRPALPQPLPILDQLDMRLYRNQIVMIVGQPGSGKSLFTLNLCTKMAQDGVRVLYVTADTDSETMMLRAAASVSQQTVQECFTMIGTSAEAIVEDAVATFDHNLVFADEPQPSMEDLQKQILAASEAWGDYPDVIVVDTLGNLAPGGDQEWAELRAAMSNFHSLCRKTGACVILLHHVSENASNPDYPAPLKAVMGKLSALPEQVWSVAMLPDQDKFRIVATKNRHGRHNKRGEGYVELAVDAARMSVYESHAAMQMSKSAAWARIHTASDEEVA